MKLKDFSLFRLSKSWLDYSGRTFTERKYPLLKALKCSRERHNRHIWLGAKYRQIQMGKRFLIFKAAGNHKPERWATFHIPCSLQTKTEHPFKIQTNYKLNQGINVAA